MKLNRMSIFETVKMPSIPRSKFDLSHEVKTTFNMGKLIPVLRQEVLPGDKFNFSQEAMLRLAPLISPVMHNVDVKTRFFFVPNRLLMDQADWEFFIMGDADAGIEWPHINIAEGSAPIGSLGDYLGYPQMTGGNNVDASVLPIAACAKIWDDYYRSESLQTEKFRKVEPGLQSGTLGVHYAALCSGDPFAVGWERDYFTSALPSPQKGDPVLIPLTNGNDTRIILDNPANPGQGRFVLATGGTTAAPGDVVQNVSGTEIGGTNVVYDPYDTLIIDDAGLNSNAATIDTLRTAFKLQQYFESLYRGGYRYFEWVRSMFAATPSDARLQRSEYIGTTAHRMVISEVLSTANTQVDTDVTPVGQMAGHGISVGGGNLHSYYAEEHGWIIGFMQVTPQTAYQQGIDRALTRQTYLDYAIPMFANIGEQAVKRKEIFVNTSGVNQEADWGYQPRYAEYRFNNSRVTGEFKTTLNFWHLGRIFETAPTLAQTIECDPSMRIFAVEEGHHIYAQVILNVYVERNLPRFGVPSLL